MSSSAVELKFVAFCQSCCESSCSDFNDRECAVACAGRERDVIFCSIREGDSAGTERYALRFFVVGINAVGCTTCQRETCLVGSTFALVNLVFEGIRRNDVTFSFQSVVERKRVTAVGFECNLVPQVFNEVEVVYREYGVFEREVGSRISNLIEFIRACECNTVSFCVVNQCAAFESKARSFCARSVVNSV